MTTRKKNKLNKHGNKLSKNIGNYHRTVLDGGIRIVTETMPQIRSLSIGIWFDTGSRDEPDDLAGISHFLEHMNFKGTPQRNPLEIAREIEGRGGQLNAFTSKEMTCFHARVIDEQLVRAVDVLSDIAQNSLYKQEDVDRERGVILEELKNNEDTPDDLVFEYFWDQLYDSHTLGRPIIGRRETIGTIDQDKLIRYRSDCYTGSRIVVSAAGHLDHTELVKIVKERLRTGTVSDQLRIPPLIPESKRYHQDRHTTTQQAHILWGCRGLAYKDPRKFPLLVLNTHLGGGGMSSRLFQTIREERGLAYSVYSFSNSYIDTGLFAVYAGTDPQKVEEVLGLISSEAADTVREPIAGDDLERIKDQLKGGLLLGLESSGSRMNRLAVREIYTGEYESLDDVIAKIDAVTAEDVQAIADELFNQQAIFTTVLLPN